MILVTGAAGHLGNVLVRELLRRGEKVRALVLRGENLTSLEGLDLELVEGNILNPEDLQLAMQGIDIVFHLAAYVGLTPEKYALMEQVNVEGTRNVIEAALHCGVRRLVYTSSIHALERPPEGVLITESLNFDPVNPAGPYDRTKAMASVLAQKAACDQFEVVIVCPTGVIGPYDFNRSEMGEMILEWMENRPSICMDGAFDFVDVRDVAQGHILASEKGRNGEVYLLAGERITVRELRNLVQETTGIRTLLINFSSGLARFVAPLAEFYYRITKTKPRFTRYSVETLQSNSVISYDKAANELGYQPRRLRVTIPDTVAWWKENLERTHASLRSAVLE